MNKEGLGRALGYGARHAARTLRSAAAAATETRTPQEGAAGRSIVADTRAARQAPRGSVLRGARAAGRSAWKPLAAFTSVVWLQVTGAFFLLFALSMGAAAWVLRGSAGGTPQRTHFYIYAALCGLFAYFALSSFVRAWRRERRA